MRTINSGIRSISFVMALMGSLRTIALAAVATLTLGVVVNLAAPQSPDGPSWTSLLGISDAFARGGRGGGGGARGGGGGRARPSGGSYNRSSSGSMRSAVCDIRSRPAWVPASCDRKDSASPISRPISTIGAA